MTPVGRKGDRNGRIVIVGAGPAGLGAAWRLQEIGCTDWDLFEKEPCVGGLASSYLDENGFTWDLGGHVVFSHYAYFDRVLDSVLKDEWIEHVREAWIWMRERFIPYPLQNNIRHLPQPELLECVDGLLDAWKCEGPSSGTFADWIVRTFGPGLARTFMTPYNRKVWATDPADMSAHWVGDRVAHADVKSILRNIIEGRDDLGWGPNATFRFPRRGGTGRIWEALAEQLGAERLHLGTEVVEVNASKKRVRLSDGRTMDYDWLITTMPMDLLLGRISGFEPQIVSPACPEGLRYSSVHAVGVGVNGRVPEHFASKCWIYFPEPELPFYRVTIFSNYSPHNVPDAGRQWSVMAEVSESANSERRATSDEFTQRTLEGLKAARVIESDSSIASLWHRRIEHAYPTPSLNRDRLLDKIEPSLYALNILSRGRFGAWKYEVGNMDHSFMQGVEAVNHILGGEPEMTVKFPAKVNGPAASGR